jgi:hypothetical protein
MKTVNIDLPSMEFAYIGSPKLEGDAEGDAEGDTEGDAEGEAKAKAEAQFELALEVSEDRSSALLGRSVSICEH